MTQIPLADRLRPATLDQVVGQPHLLGKNSVFRGAVESGTIPNMIFYGPSGVGKTTVSRIIAHDSGMQLHKLNGTSASTADIRDVIQSTGTFGTEKGLLLYLDEIQYLNKKQQQSLLEFIEDGSITLIASTTENPYFAIYNALLSRCTVFEFKALTPQDIEKGLQNAIDDIQKNDGIKVVLEDGVLSKMAYASGGDMRKALNALEFVLLAAPAKKKTKTITLNAIEQVAQRSAMRYDRAGDEHYDILSAYQKSMRGSDPDAALHYLARLLEADDLLSACRRLLICAAEDVGLAYPQILPIVKAAVDIALQVGMPEAAIPMADAVILVALAPKSNSGIAAISAATADVKRGLSGAIPRHLQNVHFDGAESDTKGQNYRNPHHHENGWLKEQYLPDALKNSTYYSYGNNKIEQAYKSYWEQIKGK